MSIHNDIREVKESLCRYFNPNEAEAIARIITSHEALEARVIQLERGLPNELALQRLQYAQIQKLEEKVVRYEKALRFYANAKSLATLGTDTSVAENGFNLKLGKIAREALEKK